MKANKIRLDKLRLKLILDDRNFYLQALYSNFDDFLEVLKDSREDNVKYVIKDNATTSADIFDNITVQSSQEQRLRAALEDYIKIGQEALDAEDYEKMKSIQMEYNILLKTYEKWFGKYKR